MGEAVRAPLVGAPTALVAGGRAQRAVGYVRRLRDGVVNR